MLALPLRFLIVGAMGLVFIAVGAALHGPTAWSSARLLRRGRRVTATVVEITPGGLTDPALIPGAAGFRRAYLPAVRLAFTLDGRRREKTLRLAGPGAETAYAPGQPVGIYVAGRLRIRIRSAVATNERGPADRVLGMCLMFAGFVSLVYFAVTLAG